MSNLLDKSRRRHFYVRILINEFFGFAEYQENGWKGLGYNLFLKRIAKVQVLHFVGGTDGSVFSTVFIWYLPHHTPSIKQVSILSKNNFSKVPLELPYIERSVFRKNVSAQIFWDSEFT